MTGIFNSYWAGGSYNIETNRHGWDRERISTEVLCTLAHKWLEYLFTTLRDMKGTMVRKTVPFWGATSLNEIDHTIIPFWVLRTVGAQFMPGLLDANLSKNKQTTTLQCFY